MSLVAYNGIQDRADDAKVKGDASNSSRQLSLKQIEGGSYPAGNTNPGLTFSEGTSVFYDSDGVAYELTVVSDRKDSISYCITSETSISKKGPCGAHVALVGSGNDEGGGSTEPVLTYMQEIDSADCTSERSIVIDKRDNKTYWVKKIGSNCWMMTDLAYDGGGNNEHGDTKNIQSATYGMDYSQPHYYKNSGMAFTTYPSEPSTSTTGLGQYGYLYTYCAAMGGQPGACRTGTVGTVDSGQSICPVGWRLPSATDFGSLTSSLGAASNAADLNTMKSEWMTQMGGQWYESYSLQGTFSSYWSATGNGNGAARTMRMDSSVNLVNPLGSENRRKGLGVRCAL